MAGGTIKNTYKAGIILAAVLVGLFVFIKYLIPYITPFIIAIVIAFLIDPVISFLEKKARLPRGLAVLFVLTVFTLLLSVFAIIGIAQIQDELQKLRDRIPDYQQMLTNDLSNLLNEASRIFNTLPKPVTDVINSNSAEIQKQVQTFVVSALDLVRGIPSFLTVFFVSILATYFISKDKTKITTFMFEFLPEKQRLAARRLEYEIMGAVVRLVRAQIILISITSLINIVGLSILRVNYAWVIGLLIGVLDVLPMIGPATILVPWCVYSFVRGAIGFSLGLAILLGLELLIRQISETKIVGKSIGVHPLATLFSIYLGYRLFGVLGFFVGPILAVIVKAVMAEAILPILKHNR